MQKRYFWVLITVFVIVLSSCGSKATTEVANIGNEEYSYGDILSYTEDEKDYKNEILEFDFSDANFYFNKLNYIKEKEDSFYTYTIEVSGNQMDLSYIDDLDSDNVYVKTTNDYKNIPNKTLYISTDLEYAIVSVPSVYNKTRIYDSISTDKKYELSVNITHDNGVYFITYAFPKNSDFISEFFYIKSQIPLINLNKDNKELITRNELSGRFRLISDGFYQASYDTYYPNGEGNYFRNCANYPAYNYIKYNNSLNQDDEVLFFNILSYCSTYVVNKNISDYGFFETKSRSEWLYNDFNIDKDFYDTRFNADNAELNLLLYNKFHDDIFIDTLNIYGQFFNEYSKNHSYKTQNGILVEDYYNPSGGDRTHVSLNHHLASLNVLLSLYMVTEDESYLDTALSMLKGVEDTCSDWILDDGNLEYALFYNGTYNTMKDYPYLTYNDLFDTRELLNKLNIDDKYIQILMDSKESYMIKNNIVGYKK